MEQLTLRRLLLELGYRTAERHDGWCECLLVAENERWLGTGLDADDALRDAVRKAFAARGARLLLEQEIARRTSGIESISNRSVAGVADKSVASPEVARSDELAAVAAAPAASQREYNADSEAEPAFDAQSARDGRENTRVLTADQAPARRASEFAAMDEWRAEQELRDLRRRITGERRELALATPRRQRLILLCWISRARAYQELLPDESAVDEAVESIARMLSGLARVFWPGSVRALQLSTRPADAVRELRTLKYVSADTWAEVAELASESIENARLEDQAAGRDAFGWADASRLFPAPTQPELMLAELTREVEDLGGRLGSVPPEDVVPSAEQMLMWVRRLRWLRGSVDDAERWGAVAGRLRYWVYKHRRELSGAERELNPEFCPEQSWMAEFERMAAESRRAAELEKEASAQQARERDYEDALDHIPSTERTDRAELLSWLVQILPFSDTHHDRIVVAARPFAELIKDITPDDLPSSDRRLRRRLDKLKQALEPGEVFDENPESADSETLQSEVDPEVASHWSVPGDVRDKVVPFTRGKRVLFISNRNDSELRDRLRELLELESLELVEGEDRRLDAAVKSIGAGAYDIVLGATGFMNHKSDERISRACRRADINYVRVDRGRPLTCLLALAKNFGADVEQSVPRAVGAATRAG